MKKPFASETRSFVTNGGTKISTYRENGAYVIAIVGETGTPDGMAFSTRAEAEKRLKFYTAFYGGKKVSAS